MHTINKEKIHSTSIFFGVFLALMMVQTVAKGIGTLSAFIPMLFVIAFGILQHKTRGRIIIAGDYGVYILLFTLESALVTVATQNAIPYKFIMEVIFLLFSANLKFNKRENGFIKTTFYIAMVVYSVLVIRYCISSVGVRYYHGDIVLLGAVINPNHIGVPFIAASCFLLDNFLHRRKRSISLILYVMMLTVVILTASRGNFVSLFVSNVMIVAYFLFGRNRSISKIRKVLVLVYCTALMLVLVYLAQRYLGKQWGRMSTINTTTDNGRLELWGDSWVIFKQNPIFGCGFGGVAKLLGHASHNTYLQVLAETGLVGAVLYVGFSIKVLLHFVRKKDWIAMIIVVSFMSKLFFLSGIDNRCIWAILSWLLTQENTEMSIPN